MWISICFAVFLLTVALYDIRDKAFPKCFLAVGGTLAILQAGLRLWERPDEWLGILLDCALGAVPGILLLLMALASGKVGEGDGIVLILSGILRGAAAGLIIFAGSLMLAVLYSLWVVIVRRRKKNFRFPYLPFAAAAYCFQLIAEGTG